MGHLDVNPLEAGLRDGLQIESADISVGDRFALLRALSETCLDAISVGSFASPICTPQMGKIDEVLVPDMISYSVSHSAMNPREQGRAAYPWLALRECPRPGGPNPRDEREWDGAVSFGNCAARPVSLPLKCALDSEQQWQPR